MDNPFLSFKMAVNVWFTNDVDTKQYPSGNEHYSIDFKHRRKKFEILISRLEALGFTHSELEKNSYPDYIGPSITPLDKKTKKPMAIKDKIRDDWKRALNNVYYKDKHIQIPKVEIKTSEQEFVEPQSEPIEEIQENISTEEVSSDIVKEEVDPWVTLYEPSEEEKANRPQRILDIEFARLVYSDEEINELFKDFKHE